MSRRNFTLLELLLVLLILGLIAGSAVLMVGGQMDQQIDAANRTRVAQLKTAICGDPNAGLGTPATPISGFVSDMGRLPVSINELLTVGAQTVNTLDTSSGSQYGWRGPYLSVIPDANGLNGVVKPRFRDAWGTVNSVLATDDLQFGWLFPAVAANGDLAIQSLGKDGLAGGSNYDADIPATGSPLISDADYNSSLSTFRVTTVTIVCAGTPNTVTYYNGTLQNKAIRLGFLTASNADLLWTSAARLDLVSDQTFVGQNTVLPAAGGNRTITIAAGSAYTFTLNNSAAQTKRVACGRRIPVLLLETAVAAGSLLKNQVVAKASALGAGPRICLSRTEYILYPRAAPLGTTTLTFDLRIP